MRCPKCGDPDTRVTDSRDSGMEIRRRRMCSKCSVRFTTYERVQPDALSVVKRDGRREDFTPHKLLHSIRIACVKRPIPSGALEKLVHDIETDLRQPAKSEIPSSAIGEAALNRLRTLDTVAYIRYASVYRDFDSLDGFIAEAQALLIPNPETEDNSSQLELIPNEFTPPPKRQPRRGRRPGITEPILARNNAPSPN